MREKAFLDLAAEVVAEAIEELLAYLRETLGDEDLVDRIQEKLENVDIVVEEWPEEEVLEELGVPPDETLFGLYQGTPQTERSSFQLPTLPDRIVLYQGPIAEACRGRREVREQIRGTVIHEIGHHFGMTEDQLRELGVG